MVDGVPGDAETVSLAVARVGRSPFNQVVYAMNMLAGTGSERGAMLAALPPGSCVYAFDLEPRDHTVLKADVFQWRDGSEWPPDPPASWVQRFGEKPPQGLFEITWAGPVCTYFSRARTTGRASKRGSPEHKELMKAACALVRHIRHLLNGLRSRVYFLENPRGGLELQPCMRDLAPDLRPTTWCMWGTPFKKPEGIWTNLRVDLPCCSAATPCQGLRERWAKRLRGHGATAQLGPTRAGMPGAGTSDAVNPTPPKLVKYLMKEVLRQWPLL
jgi:hypothetical protein